MNDKSVDILRNWKKTNPQVENIMIFISDSLRWDYLPESVKQKGVTFKTIASSLYTASSFPSIVSGLYPYHHGVYSFYDQLPNGIKTLLNVSSHNTSFWTENTWIDFEPKGSSDIHRILRCNNLTTLEDLKPPFIYLEDEKGGHCPYGWSEDDIYKEDECKKFYQDYSKKSNRELRERYQKGIERSAKEFEKRIQILEKRQLVDKTLIIFLSDHGELLGEHGGIIGHGHPTTSEIVYVPMVFIHPNLPKGLSFENEGVLRHVDLFPSILDLLNINFHGKVDGINIFNSKKLPATGYTNYEMEVKREGLFKYFLNIKLSENSIWDNSGGYVFRQGVNILSRLFYMIYSTVLSDQMLAIYLRGRQGKMTISYLKNYVRIIKTLCSSSIKYGTPSFGFKEAEKIIKKMEESKIDHKEIIQMQSTINRLKLNGKI